MAALNIKAPGLRVSNWGQGKSALENAATSSASFAMATHTFDGKRSKVLTCTPAASSASFSDGKFNVSQ
jgi:hypothetical protein